MSARVRVEADQGGAVAVKTAHTDDELAALRYEAALLRRTRHPGVVVFSDGDGDPELRTRYAGQALDRWSGNLRRSVGVGAAVAAILGDLHELEIVHGRVDESHILIGRDGLPRLCGFRPPGELGPADDVAALATVVDRLVQRTTANDPRWPHPRRRGGVADREALSKLLQRATDPNPQRRPTARAFATALLAAVPGAEVPSATTSAVDPRATSSDPGPQLVQPGYDPVFGDQTTTESDAIFVDRPWWESSADDSSGPPKRLATRPKQARPQPTRRPHQRKAVRVGAMATVVGIVGVAGVTLVLTAGQPPPSGELQAASAADPAPLCPAAPRSSPNPGTGRDRVVADVDGDGCDEAVQVRAGVVEVDGRRWQVGAVDDLVAVGDWDCDGRATPAVYRPSTGDVFVYPGWATAGHPVSVSAVERIAGGQRLTATGARAADARRCTRLAVVLASGAPHVVEVPK